MEKKSRYTPAQNKATQKYHAEHMEEIKFRAQRSERLSARIAQASTRRGISKAQYMSDAIRAALDADGVTLDSIKDD